MKNIKIIIGIVIGVIIIGIISIFIWYKSSLNEVKKENAETKIIEIQEGTRTEGILELLKKENLIKSKWASAIYIKLNGIKGLQAGVYQISQDMSTKDVLAKIESGDVYDETIKITFKEGKNMRWIAETIAENTSNTEEDVYELLKDKEYINSLINKYWFLTDVITNENIYYPLEGYLYPDTYIFENKDVSVKTIFNIILNNTDTVLKKYQTQISQSGRSVHQILTIASIIELEGNDTESRNGISSVIYNRLRHNMSLGSDVTTYYAMQVDMGERNLYSSELKTANPYNTRGPNMNGKLPIGPIGNPSEESINSALNPAKASYLYFVADSNGKIYFTSTYAEHQNIIKSLQKQGLWYEYE